MAPFWQRDKDKSQAREAGDDVLPPPLPPEEPRRALDEVVPQVGVPEVAARPAESVEVAPPSFLPSTASVDAAPVPAPEIPDIPEPSFVVDAAVPSQPALDEVSAPENPSSMSESGATESAAAAVDAAAPVDTEGSVEPLVPEPVEEPIDERPVASESEEQVAAAGGELASIVASIGDLADSVARFDQRLDVAIKGNEWGRSALNKLADEMDVYRKNFLAEAQLPLLKRLCTFHGSIEKVARESAKPEDFTFLAEQVLDILADYGVEPLNDAIGEKLLGKRHRGLKAIPTDQAELDGTIAETVSKGWLSAERVITPQVVYVYKFEAISEVESTEPPTPEVAPDAAADAEPAPLVEEATEPGQGLSSEDEGGNNE